MAANETDVQTGQSIFEELSAADKDNSSKDVWPSPVQAVETKEIVPPKKTSENVNLPSRYRRKL